MCGENVVDKKKGLIVEEDPIKLLTRPHDILLFFW